MQRVARIAKPNEMIEARPEAVVSATSHRRDEVHSTMPENLMLARLLELNLAREGV